MSQQIDLEANLVAMDGKLRELQHELSGLTIPAEAQHPAPKPGVRLDVQTTPPPDHPSLPLAAAAADQARAIIADAQAEAARIVGDAAQRVTAITAQIDNLQRLRDELERSARALVDEYSAAVSRAGQPAAVAERSEGRDEPPVSPVHPPLW